MARTAAEKRRVFHELHREGCFVIPNPWDLGSAKYLESLGFKALATTSSGFAWTQAMGDATVPRDKVLEHLHAMCAATDLPVNADFEKGYAEDLAGVAESVRLAVEAGVAGLSIEDYTGDDANPLYDIDTAVARIEAARRAIDATGGDTMLVGRAETFLVGRPDIDETIARLKAYSNAGADCLYAPVIKTREHIAAVVKAVHPKPVNLLIGWASDLDMKQVAELGVRRVSVGGALARAAWGGFTRAAKLLAEEGKFDGLGGNPSNQELNALFA